MVNNAGIYDANTIFGSYHVSTDMRVLQTNLVGTILGTTLALEKMSLEGGGAGGLVVQISSVAALMTTGASSLYQASKYGILGYVRSHGAEAEKMTGVRMVAVCPGRIITGSIVFFIYTVPLASSDWHGGIASFASRPLQLATLPMAWPCWQEDIITLPVTPCSWHNVTGFSCL